MPNTRRRYLMALRYADGHRLTIRLLFLTVPLAAKTIELPGLPDGVDTRQVRSKHENDLSG